MEVEIKLNVKPAIPGGPIMLFTKLTMLPQLGGVALGPITKHEIRDLYYDTPDGKLAAAGAGLRSRLVDTTPHVTLKTSEFRDGALTAREEFEEVLTEERFNWVLSQVADLVGEGPFSMADFAAGRPCGPLVPVLEVNTARIVRPVAEAAELTLDLVEYPGLSVSHYFDIEVESKAGRTGERVLRLLENELYELSENWLAPAAMSKLERGLKLKQRTQSQ